MKSSKNQQRGRRPALKTKKSKRRLKKQTKRGPYINLTNDIVFQYFFKKDETVLKSLLKAFLPLRRVRVFKRFKCWILFLCRTKTLKTSVLFLI